MKTTTQEINENFNKYKLQIKKCLKKIKPEVYDFKQSTQFEDTKLSFDCSFSNYKRNKITKVSVRLRSNQFFGFKGNYDITIRSKSQGGNKTELDKLLLIDDQDHLYFYGWLSSDENTIVKGVVIDMNMMKGLNLLESPDQVIPNRNKYDTDNTELSTYNLDRLFFHYCIIGGFGITPHQRNTWIKNFKL